MLTKKKKYSPSSTDIRDSVHSSVISYENSSSYTEAWSDRDIEASITVQDTWIAPIHFQPLQ